jgi:hypothetical protein
MRPAPPEAKKMTKMVNYPDFGWKGAAIAVAFVMLPEGEASAQGMGWRYSASVYGWFAGLDTSVDTAFVKVETDLSFSDIWADLDMAFMGTFEARSGQLGLILDLNYTDLSMTQATPLGAAFRSAQVDTTLTILSGYVTWRMSDTAAAKVDLAGGFRAYDLDLGVALTPGALSAQSFSDSERWIDPVIGGRVTFTLAEKWYATAAADVGGFGIGSASDLSHQTLATVGYRFNDKWSAEGGYRHIGIEKALNGRDVTLDLSGPLFGVTARF